MGTSEPAHIGNASPQDIQPRIATEYIPKPINNTVPTSESVTR